MLAKATTFPRHQRRRGLRVRAGETDLEGLRDRERAVQAGYEHFRKLALLTLRDPRGTAAVGELLIEVATGKVPLFAESTRKRFEKVIS